MEHVRFIKLKSSLKISQLLSELKLSDPDDPKYITDLRRGYINEKMEVVRVFVHVASSSELSCVGWVVNETCAVCMVCARRFGTVMRRHHCRACGLLICKVCSLLSRLERLDNLGFALVCRGCFAGAVST
ncbi:hypothetical protein EON64_17885 [archaeon]|nr:MAG: hypothetical protein EON64_17885 [archaeon]